MTGHRLARFKTVENGLGIIISKCSDGLVHYNINFSYNH